MGRTLQQLTAVEKNLALLAISKRSQVRAQLEQAWQNAEQAFQAEITPIAEAHGIVPGQPFEFEDGLKGAVFIVTQTQEPEAETPGDVERALQLVDDKAPDCDDCVERGDVACLEACAFAEGVAE